MKNKTNLYFGLELVNSERPLLPEQNDEYKTIAGRDGKEHVAKGMGDTTLDITFIKQNTSVEQWLKDRRDIVGWLYSKNEIDVYFDDEPNVHFIGKVTASTVPDNYLPVTEFDITLTLHPFRYGKEVTEELVFDAENLATVTNNSNYETPYILTITATNSTTSLSVTVDGYEITYNKAINAGDVITINTNELELAINDELKIVEVDGYFMFLQPGQSKIKSNITGLHMLDYTGRFL